MNATVKTQILDCIANGVIAKPVSDTLTDMVKVSDILNIGIVMSGKLPDVYWDLDLTAAEFKILRYVFNNVLRIYKTLKIYPRDHSGAPRFWRRKERMAEECKVSTTTFRNGVRHLAEMGLVTSMDNTDDYDLSAYCIGLSVKFLDTDFIQKRLSNVTTLEKYDRLASYLYSTDSLEYVKRIDDSPFKKFVKSEVVESLNVTRVSIVGVVRVPIKYKAVLNVERIPIIHKKTVVELAQEQRGKYDYVFTPDEKQILEVKSYYEYKCRLALNATGFCSISTKKPGFREDKKWKWLVRLTKQCIENDWDYKIFIDAQFDRLQHFQTGQKYVFLNQFFSDNAINYFFKYITDYKQRHSVTGEIKIKTSKIQTFVQDVIDAVINDCERISYFIQTAPKRPAYRGLSAVELKIMYFSQHWMALSKYYLSDIPWFLDWLGKLPQEKLVVELVSNISDLRKSSAIMKKIHKVVQGVEVKMDIPPTPSPESMRGGL